MRRTSSAESPHLDPATRRRGGGLPLICLCATLLSAPSVLAQEAPIPLDTADGLKALASGDRLRALQLFEAGLEDHQQPSPQAWRLIGDLRFHFDDRPGALKAWQAALPQKPGDFGLQRRVAHGAELVGDFALAAKARSELARIARQTVEDASSPTSGQVDAWAEAVMAWSVAAVLAGDFTTAEEAARQLDDPLLDEADPRAALAVGYVLVSGGELEEAEAAYQDALKLSPDHAGALNNLGMIAYLQGDYDLAAERYEATLEAPTLPKSIESTALANLAEIIMLQQGFGDAEGLLKGAIEVQPEGAWGHMGMAALMDITGRYDEAMDAMITGWRLDAQRVNRLNTRFIQDEWYWQRDALIAEIEGDEGRARWLWSKVLEGEVEALYDSAAYHLFTLQGDAR